MELRLQDLKADDEVKVVTKRGKQETTLWLLFRSETTTPGNYWLTGIERTAGQHYLRQSEIVSMEPINASARERLHEREIAGEAVETAAAVLGGDASELRADLLRMAEQVESGELSVSDELASSLREIAARLGDG